MQTKVGRCLVTIIANGGETSLNQDNLRLIPSFLILIIFCTNLALQTLCLCNLFSAL